jgi:hypothetical protein
MTEHLPALARLCFRVPPERMSEFESAFESRLLPRLQDRGLTPAADLGRPTVPGVFHRLFPLEETGQITRVRGDLEADADWAAALDEIGGDLGATISCTFHSYRAAGLQGRRVDVDESTEGRWTTYTTANLVSGDLVTCILRDSRQRFWFTTAHAGTTMFDGNQWHDFEPETGLPVDRCWALFEDSEGGIWFGSHRSGVTRFHGDSWMSFTQEDGLPSNSVISGYQDGQGRLWFGSDVSEAGEGLACLNGDSWTLITVADGLADNRVKWITQDRDNRHWIGTAGGVSVYDGSGWRTYDTGDGLPGNWVETILQDREGDMWVATDRGLAHFDGVEWTGYTAQDGLPGSWVTAAFQDSRDILWFGTLNAGVCCFDGETFQTLNHEDGLSGDAVWWIYEDEMGDLWFATDGGVSRYRPPEPDPPAVKLNAVTADRRYEQFDDLVLPASADLVAFEFDGESPHTRHSGLVYRHRLVGCDDEWRTTYRRRAEYSYIEPGTYKFQVQVVDQLLDYSPILETEFTVQDLQGNRIGELEESVAELSRRLEEANHRLRDAGLPQA